MLFGHIVSNRGHPAKSSFEGLLEKDDEHEFWRQPLPSDSRAFMSSILRGMKKFIKEQIRLRKQIEEQITRLHRIEEG